MRIIKHNVYFIVAFLIISSYLAGCSNNSTTGGSMGPPDSLSDGESVKIIDNIAGGEDNTTVYEYKSINASLELTSIYVNDTIMDNSGSSNCVSLEAPSKGSFNSFSIRAKWNPESNMSNQLRIGYLHSKGDGNFTSGVITSGGSPLYGDAILNISLSGGQQVAIGILPDKPGLILSQDIDIYIGYRHNFDSEPEFKTIGCGFFNK